MNKLDMSKSKPKIGIIGLGYVGLPLAVEFGKKYNTIGFDINSKRVDELLNYVDITDEIKSKELKKVLIDKKSFKSNKIGLLCSNNLQNLMDCDVYIVTVPTPTDSNNNPVLTPLIKASKTVGGVLSRGNYVVYESTVFPGATEEICIPILEKESKLKLNEDFFVGYSPERINPGDKKRTVSKILKLTSGSNESSAEFIDNLYKSVITAGTYKVNSIKVAEAAKVIENSQRDINIAFVNELAKIFNKIGIDTQDVLDAASTKWNFLPFRPGLVGGHCIGVDPYYLAQKAEEVGYHPEIILAGRRLNDNMGKYVANQVVKLMIKNNIKILNSKVLILGITFKENCPDIRNSRVIDVYEELKSFGIDVEVYDPLANVEEVKKVYGFSLIKKLKTNYDSIILAVAHSQIIQDSFFEMFSSKSIIYDVKGVLSKNLIDSRL